MSDIFKRIYETCHWGSKESRSGYGSTLHRTELVRAELLHHIKELSVESFLDCPCGDFNWMKEIVGEIPGYIGADVVREIITDNKKKYPDISFRVLDIVKDDLPQVDMIFCRDCLVHLPNVRVKLAIEQIKRAKPKYIVLTHFPNAKNKDIIEGKWRSLDMTKFLDDDFKQIGSINEIAKDKTLGIWSLRS